MLLIVMHNNKNYLLLLNRLMKKGGATRTKVIENQATGVCLVGLHESIISLKSSLQKAYDKMLIAVIEGSEKMNRLIDLIDTDPSLIFLNMGDKGFVCSLPFKEILK
ncbi:MAG: hypothetical protein ABIB11_01175 [Candidatus Omnitrophota bacterium]